MRNGNMIKTISRTSSQKSAQRENNGIQYEYENNGVQISRMQSHNRPFKDPEHNGNIEEHFSQEINSNIVDQRPDLEENNELEHARADKYQTYRQMCKDIEFIQMLGNPNYVLCLRDRGYFYSKDFKDYINGLKCFLKKPELMRLIKYPQGLYNLELLLKKGFIEALQNISFQQRFIVDSLKRNMRIKSNIKKLRDFDMQSTQPTG